MSELQELIEDFDSITEIAYDLSQQFDGAQSLDRKRKTSTYYLAKIVPECMSLLRVLPGSRFTDPSELFDFPSFCSISRNLIEACNLHWYFCIENINKEQSEFRFFLYDFHDFRSTIQIANFIGAEKLELQNLQSKCEELKSQIKGNSLFNSLLPEVQRQILKGRKCSALNQTEITQIRGLDTDDFNGINKLLSKNTHSTPSAISAIVHSQIYGQELNDSFACLILSYVASFVADLIRTIGEIWNLEFAKKESEEIINSYSEALRN